MHPIRIFGKRTSCCCFFTSLYHETKQMGIVLRKSFKGTHLWIPAIEKQLKDMERVRRESKTDPVSASFLNLMDTSLCETKRFKPENQKKPVKIDAMFFPATEEKVTLIGNENKIDRKQRLDRDDFHPLEVQRNPSPIQAEMVTSMIKNERRYLELDTFIICNPNAMNYQQTINYPHAYYLKYFLNKQINVLLWNYRGYGRTKGKPTPENICQDIDQVFHFLKSRVGVKGKIGVYGRSLGCIAAIHIKEHADMVIADRGFCDLWTLAREKFYGRFAEEFFKFSTQGWQASNSYRYLTCSSENQTAGDDEEQRKVSSCYKVILCDKADEIVGLQSSTMVGVARELCTLEAKKKELPLDRAGILSSEETETLLDTLLSLLELEDELICIKQAHTANVRSMAATPVSLELDKH